MLPSYLQEKSSSDKVVYSEQRRRMEAIRATALALRYLQSSLPMQPLLGPDEKPAVFRNGGIGREYNL